jgi:hypothetical protein
VFKMIEEQFKNTLNPNAKYFYHYPECLTAQFMLPCFVASLLDLCKEKNVPQIRKYNYTRFVNELILSYERHPFNQRALPSLAASNFVSFIKVMNLKLSENTSILTNSLNIFIGKNNALINFYSKCIEYLKNNNLHRPFLEPRELDSLNPIRNVSHHWDSYLLFFISRISVCLEKLNWVSLKPSDDEFCSHLGVGWNMIPLKSGSLLDHIQNLLISTIGKVSFEEGDITFFVNFSKIPRNVRLAAEKLSYQQLLTLCNYLYLKSYNFKKVKIKQQVFPLDTCSQVYDALLLNKKWNLKLLMASARNEVEDFSLVSFKCAKKNVCYKSAMGMLSSKGKLNMRSPGEITFCPIKHCRWCGQADVQTFRVCPLCKDDPEYPDLNFFCSEECENLCLKKQHNEEHDQYLMMLINGSMVYKKN